MASSVASASRVRLRRPHAIAAQVITRRNERAGRGRHRDDTPVEVHIGGRGRRTWSPAAIGRLLSYARSRPPPISRSFKYTSQVTLRRVGARQPSVPFVSSWCSSTCRASDAPGANRVYENSFCDCGVLCKSARPRRAAQASRTLSIVAATRLRAVPRPTPKSRHTLPRRTKRSFLRLSFVSRVGACVVARVAAIGVLGRGSQRNTGQHPTVPRRRPAARRPHHAPGSCRRPRRCRARRSETRRRAPPRAHLSRR